VTRSAQRRQLSLFVAEPESAELDALRARADPVQHALIPAHVTLVRDEDVDDWSAVRARLEALAPLRLELELGPPRPMEGGGAFLPVVGPSAAFDELRARLLLGQRGEARAQTPHLTLLHPRNRARWGLTLEQVCAQRTPARVAFDHVVMIEQVAGAPWRIVARSRRVARPTP